MIDEVGGSTEIQLETAPGGSSRLAEPVGFVDQFIGGARERCGCEGGRSLAPERGVLR